MTLRLIPTRQQWNSWSMPSKYSVIGVILAVVGLVLTVALSLISEGTKPHAQNSRFPAGSVQAIETSGDHIVATMENGATWSKAFGAPVSQVLVEDLDGDHFNEVLVGLGSSGEDHSSVLLLSSVGEQVWKYQQPPDYPYSGASSGRFRVVRLGISQTGEGLRVVVLFNDAHWYQSCLVTLNPLGERAGILWHPGHLHDLLVQGPMLFVAGVNNDLGATAIGLEGQGHPGVLFAVDSDDVYGQAPPYFGGVERNTDLAWYSVLSRRDVRFSKLESGRNGGVAAWTSCGLVIQVSAGGNITGSQVTDSYSCDRKLALLKVNE